MAYDLAGNIVTVTGGGETTSYTYDGANRLTGESYSTGGSISYTYDRFNNRVGMTKGGTTVSYAYDKNNRLTASTETAGNTVSKYAYYYDHNGNLISRTKDEVQSAQSGTEGNVVLSVDSSPYLNTYAYDGWNRLTSANTGGILASYAYRGNNLRESKTVTADGTAETTSFVYDGMDIVYDTDGTEAHSYVRGASGLLYSVSGGTATYYRTNFHGDVSALANSSGTATQTYKYDSFGNEWTESTSANPFRYNGEYTDLSSGLIYLRNRYYDPSIGRFISEDPIKDGLNWYVYANNNPIMFFDPFGLAPTTKEAAEMADHIYHWDQNNDKKDRIVSGWRLIDVWWGRESMKMGIYIRNSDDWENPSEYVIVFKGTDNLQNWVNNAEAYLSSKSADMWDAINYSKGFVGSHSQEITFVGHSKGGGEAIAAATATNKNAITFNAANFNFSKYGLTETNKSGIKNYYVDGEVLSAAIGYARFGTTQPLLPTQYWTVDWSIFGREIKIPAPIKNHYMDAVKRAL